MPMYDLAERAQLREVGRLRMGAQESFTRQDGSEGARPVRLDRWRLTSGSEALLEAAGRVFGGVPRRWDGAPVDEAFELFTDAAELSVLLPPENVLDQWWELWSGGGLQRRCDGRAVTVAKRTRPCLCPPDPEDRQDLAKRGQACRPHTRLWVFLPQVPGLGLWRLEAHGFYAAVELAGVAQLLAQATSSGRALPAKLRIDHRQVKRPGEPPKKFTVPVIDVDATVGQVLDAVGATLALGPAGDAPRAALDSGTRVVRELDAGDDWPVSDGPLPRPDKMPDKGAGADGPDRGGRPATGQAGGHSRDVARTGPEPAPAAPATQRPAFLEPDEPPLPLEPDPAPAGREERPDWDAEAAAAGVPTGRVLRKAREVAAELGVHQPLSVHTITDPRLVAAVRAWLAGGAS
jgi:hypothetical protein